MVTLNRNNLISRSASNLLRIIFESCVLVHHLASSSNPFIQEIIWALGPMAVSGFILLSGFGVGMSYKKRGASYLSKLIKQRVPRTYGLIVLTDLFYILLFFIEEEQFNGVFGFIVSVLYLPVFKEFSYLSHWVYFLADLIVYYLMFFVVGHIMKKRKDSLFKTAVTIFCVQALIVAVVSVINSVTGNSGSLRGCFMFPMGLLIANYSEELTSVVRKYKYELVTGLFLVATLFFFSWDGLFADEYVIGSLFALSLFFLFHGFEIRSHVLDICSHLILFVYLSHELVFKSIRFMFPSLSWQLRMLCTLVLVLGATALLYGIIYNKCIAIYKKRRLLSGDTLTQR